MADGKVSMPYSVFLGYDKGEDGNLVVSEKEARIVRLIYRKFMEDMAPIGICRMYRRDTRTIPIVALTANAFDGVTTNRGYEYH